VTEGDNTGTPWVKPVVDDLWGLQQALLLRAGIPPTDIPETAAVSQYYDALQTLFGVEVSTTTAILTTDLSGSDGVTTHGYTTRGDGGHGVWYATGTTSPGDAGTTDFPLKFIYDSVGTQFKLVPGVVNPRQFGATGDGATNDTVAVQSALTAVAAENGGVVYFSKGIYKLDAQLTTFDRVVMRGDGPGVSILDWSNAAGLFPQGCCLFATGSTVAKGMLGASLAPGDQLVTFAGSHNLDPGDLVLINDPRSQSYAAGLTNSRAGEFMVVSRDISASQISVENPVYATTNTAVNLAPTTYDPAQCDMFQVVGARCAVQDLELRGISDTNGNRVVRMEWARDCAFERLLLTQTENAHVELLRSYNVRFVDVRMVDGDKTGSSNRGITLAHCQRVELDRVQGGGSNHTLTVIEGLAAPTSVNREIMVTDSRPVQDGDGIGSVFSTRTTEHLTLQNSTINGAVLGGDKIRVQNCVVYGQVSDTAAAGAEGSALDFAEMTGFDIQIQNCKFVAMTAAESATALVHHADVTSIMDRPGMCVISDCVFDMSGEAGRPLEMQASRTVADYPSLRVSDCTFEGIGTAVTTDRAQIWANSGASWQTVTFEGCSFTAQGLTILNAERAEFLGVTVDRPGGEGIEVAQALASPFPTRFVRFDGCHVIECNDAGIRVRDQTADCIVANTVSLNNNRNASKTNTRSSFVFDPTSGASTTRLTLKSCVFGDDQTAPTQTFAYYYNNVDDVIDSATTILGALAPDRNATGVEKIGSNYDTDADETEFTGSIGVAGGDPSDATLSALNTQVVIGSGSECGVVLAGSPTGENTIVSGESGDVAKFELAFDHNNDRVTVEVDTVKALSIENDNVSGFADDVIGLGRDAVRWAGVYSRQGLHGTRLFVDAGTALTPGSDLALGGNWGAGGAIDTVNSDGRDAAISVFVDSGTAAGANPTVTYTWPDGDSGGVRPRVLVTDRSASLENWTVTATTNLACTVTFHGTPADSTAYKFDMFLVWPDD
jgi:hypothetical protein